MRVELYLKNIFSIASKDCIPYFNNLPSSQKAKLTYLTEEEASKLFGCNFREGIFIEPNDQRHLFFNESKLKWDGIISGIPKKKLYDEISAIQIGGNENMLAIAKMNDKVGYGVFAIKDIPKHTVVCIYSGEIKLGRRVTTIDTNDLKFYTGNFRIIAKEIRGMGSYMQHLPAKTDHLKMKEMVATTNVMPEYIVMYDENNLPVPVVVFVTLRDIKEGEQVGFSYGWEFWETRGVPSYFDHNGNILENLDTSIQDIKKSCEFHRPSCLIEPKL